MVIQQVSDGGGTRGVPLQLCQEPDFWTPRRTPVSVHIHSEAKGAKRTSIRNDMPTGPASHVHGGVRLP
jgi:hypothetical protein